MLVHIVFLATVGLAQACPNQHFSGRALADGHGKEG